MENKGRLILISILAVIVLILFVVGFLLVNIWTPEDTEINTYNYSDFETKIANTYKRQLEVLLNKKNIKLLADKLDENYLKSNNLNREDINSISAYLNSKHLLSTNPQLLEYTYSENLDTGVYVYTFTYKTNGFKRKAYLIETEPYVYTVSLDQENASTSATSNVVADIEGIEFKLDILESELDSLKYNLKITNNSTNIVKFDFDDVSNVELKLKDGTVIKQGGIVVDMLDDYELTPSSYMNKELFFAFPTEKHGQVESIIIYNVLVNNRIQEFIIEF